jgi:hypothetical protein
VPSQAGPAVLSVRDGAGRLATGAVSPAGAAAAAAWTFDFRYR